MPEMTWAVREIDPVAERATFDSVVSLRLRGWASLVSVPLTPDDLVDPHDEAARHWVALADDRVVGAARLTVHDVLEDVPEADCLGGVFPVPPPAPIGFLSRLVVAPEYRRRGVGRSLDEVRIREAEAARCRSLLVLVFEPSGEARVTQLTAQGFTVRGRGRRDAHPKWSVLPEPLVLERVYSW